MPTTVYEVLEKLREAAASEVDKITGDQFTWSDPQIPFVRPVL